MPSDVEQRLNELELRYLEQQDLVQSLNEVIYAQQRKIDILASEIQLLKKRLQGEPGLVDANADEKPPHY